MTLDDAFRDTLKEFIADVDVLGSGVSVSDVEITATSINSTTGPAEVEVQVTIKNVGTAEEAQGIADRLDASVTNGALNDALKEYAPGNGSDDALVPETVDSSTDVVQVPVVPIEVTSTLILSLEDATGFDKDGDSFQDTLKESIADVLGPGVGVSESQRRALFRPRGPRMSRCK